MMPCPNPECDRGRVLSDGTELLSNKEYVRCPFSCIDGWIPVSPEVIQVMAEALFAQDEINDVMKPWHHETALFMWLAEHEWVIENSLILDNLRSDLAP